jgi:hypothetical protein
MEGSGSVQIFTDPDQGAQKIQIRIQNSSYKHNNASVMCMTAASICTEV